MRRLCYTALLLSVMLLAGCKGDTTRDREDAGADSLSRAQQQLLADSLKKNNPLLIMPPDSQYTGEYVDKYPNGIVKFHGQFRFGERHGHWQSFLPNGTLWSEMHYDKGLRHGQNITYRTDGTMRYEGYYRNDEKDSTWKFHDEKGKLVKIVEYKSGRVISQRDVGSK